VIVPILVVTEVTYLLASRVNTETEVRFLGDLAAGNLVPEHVAARDWLRMCELIARYRDLPLGAVDASVVVAAERLGAHSIATLDRSLFSVVRPAHASGLDLLP
jgi:predicted nucleic acid-binding protein